MSAATLSPRTEHAIAELENIIAAMQERHDERVTELLTANNREVERRRAAIRERDHAQTILRAVAAALTKTEAERNNANDMLRIVMNELDELRGDQPLALEDGTEA